MANTSHENFVVQGGNFLVYIPGTYDTDGKLASLGTAVKFEALIDAKVTIPFDATKTEYNSITLANGATVEVPKNTKVYDGVTGTEKSGAGSEGYASIEMTSSETDNDSITALQAISGTQGIACVSRGEDALGANAGYVFVHCRPTGKIELAQSGNKFQDVKTTFEGLSGVAATGFDFADLNTAFGIAVDPMASDAITKIIDTGNAFVAGDLTALMDGEAVLMDAA